MTNNEAPEPIVQEKQSDNRRTVQYNQISCVNDTIKDSQGPREQAIDPKKDYFGMTTFGRGPELKALPWPFRTGFCDERSVAFGLPSSDMVSNLDGQRNRGSKATSLPRTETWDQALEVEGLQDPLLFDDEIPAKSSDLKRRAEEIKVLSKRSRYLMATDDDDDDDDDVVLKPRRGYSSFACPFYRLDSSRHIDCLSMRLTRISDVKQHLKRRHTSNFSCTRCLKGFASSKDYEDHVLQQTCAITDRGYNDGVSPAAQDALRSRVDKSLSPEKQWFKIWETLFGDDGHRPNPYHDSVFKEVTGIIRGIWRSEEQSIISSLRDGGIFEKEEQTIISNLKETPKIPSIGRLRSLLFEILTRVEDSFEQKGKTSLRSKPQEQRKITKDSPRRPSEERNVEENYETSLGFQGLEDNTGQLEIDERYTLPMQDWPFPADFATSDNVFISSMLPGYQKEQAEYPCDDLSTSLPNHDEQGNWPLIGSTSAGAADNIMLHQTSESTKDCIFVEGNLTSAEIPTMFD